MQVNYGPKIKGLKSINGFTVVGPKERAKALKEAANMKKYGLIEFEVSSREIEPGKFKVFAL